MNKEARIGLEVIEGFSLIVCGDRKPYPIIFSPEGKEVSPLFDNIPTAMLKRFWKVMKEYNIFLEVEDDGCE